MMVSPLHGGFPSARETLAAGAAPLFDLSSAPWAAAGSFEKLFFESLSGVVKEELREPGERPGAFPKPPELEEKPADHEAGRVVEDTGDHAAADVPAEDPAEGLAVVFVSAGQSTVVEEEQAAPAEAVSTEMAPEAVLLLGMTRTQQEAVYPLAQENTAEDPPAGTARSGVLDLAGLQEGAPEIPLAEVPADPRIPADRAGGRFGESTARESAAYESGPRRSPAGEAGFTATDSAGGAVGDALGDALGNTEGVAEADTPTLQAEWAGEQIPQGQALAAEDSAKAEARRSRFPGLGREAEGAVPVREILWEAERISLRAGEEELSPQVRESPGTEKSGENRRGRRVVELRDYRDLVPQRGAEAPSATGSSSGSADSKLHAELGRTTAGLNPGNPVERGGRDAGGGGFEDILARELRQTVNNDIVRNAQVILRDGGEGLIRLSLKPESLGNVKIRLELTDNK
ncbi:MAG: hypothetical protein LBU19_09080, partial [Treponema sp.]|nr:hypothetical protein [Treponema sp.]